MCFLGVCGVGGVLDRSGQVSPTSRRQASGNRVAEAYFSRRCSVVMSRGGIYEVGTCRASIWRRLYRCVRCPSSGLPPLMEPGSINRVALPRDRACPLAEAEPRHADSVRHDSGVGFAASRAGCGNPSPRVGSQCTSKRHRLPRVQAVPPGGGVTEVPSAPGVAGGVKVAQAGICSRYVMRPRVGIRASQCAPSKTHSRDRTRRRIRHHGVLRKYSSVVVT